MATLVDHQWRTWHICLQVEIKKLWCPLWCHHGTGYEKITLSRKYTEKKNNGSQNTVCDSLELARCQTFLSRTGDDLLLVQTAIVAAAPNGTKVVADSTEILILLWYHIHQNKWNVLKQQEPMRGAAPRRVHAMQHHQSVNFYQSPVPLSLLGCDTTSHLLVLASLCD